MPQPKRPIEIASGRTAERRRAEMKKGKEFHKPPEGRPVPPPELTEDELREFDWLCEYIEKSVNCLAPSDGLAVADIARLRVLQQQAAEGVKEYGVFEVDPINGKTKKTGPFLAMEGIVKQLQIMYGKFGLTPSSRQDLQQHVGDLDEGEALLAKVGR